MFFFVIINFNEIIYKNTINITLHLSLQLICIHVVYAQKARINIRKQSFQAREGTYLHKKKTQLKAKCTHTIHLFIKSLNRKKGQINSLNHAYMNFL